MKHRSYRGKLSYLTDGVGETGREWFFVTIQPDGTRTMRATCEMDDDSLLRDVVMTVDPNWYPVDAYVRLIVNERLVGTSWFCFTDHSAECEAVTAQDGRVSQRFDTAGRVGFFGAHPLHGDAWGCAALQRDASFDHEVVGHDFSTSHLPNGGSGPRLNPTPSSVDCRKYIGDERIEVGAGSFDTRHFQFFVAEYPPIDIWTLGSDFVPVRLRWDLLNQTYDLVELTGDPA